MREKMLFADKDALLPKRTMEQIFAEDKTFKLPGFRSSDPASTGLNWHCSCVQSAVSAPCGAPFRAFMTCIDKLTSPRGDKHKKSDVSSDKPYFCDAEREWLYTCMQRNSSYYEPLLRRLNAAGDDDSKGGAKSSKK